MSSSNGSFTTSFRRPQTPKGGKQGNGQKRQNQGFRGNSHKTDDIPYRKFTIPLKKSFIFGKHENRVDLLNKYPGVQSIFVNFNKKYAMKGADHGLTGVTLTIRGEVSQINACFKEGKRRIQQSFESDARRKHEENAQRIENIVSKMEESAKNAKQNVETMNVTPKNTGKKNGFQTLGLQKTMSEFETSQNISHQKQLDKEAKRNLAEQKNLPASTEWANVVKTKKKIVRSTSLTDISTTRAVTAGDCWGDFADE